MRTNELEIVQETNHYVIHRDWVYQEVWARSPGGRVELWQVRLHPVSAR